MRSGNNLWSYARLWLIRLRRTIRFYEDRAVTVFVHCVPFRPAGAGFLNIIRSSKRSTTQAQRNYIRRSTKHDPFMEYQRNLKTANWEETSTAPLWSCESYLNGNCLARILRYYRREDFPLVRSAQRSLSPLREKVDNDREHTSPNCPDKSVE